MTFEELYAKAKAMKCERDIENDRHLAELHRLARLTVTAGQPPTARRQPLSRLLRREG
jgi:hypothetical protein